MITLLDYFTIALQNGQTFRTEWVRVPESHQNWQLEISFYGLISTAAGSIQLETCWETDQGDSVGSSVAFTATSPDKQDITTGMGPMARLVFVATADSVLTLSSRLTPKSD